MKKKSGNCVPPRIISRKEDSEFVLSRSEAAQMLDNEKGYPTVAQIIERAKSKVDWPDERWAEIENMAIIANKRRRGQHGFRGFTLPRLFPRHRILAAVCSFVLLLGAIFAFVPEGRAFAAQVYEAIIKIFDNRAEVYTPDRIYTEREYDNSIAEDFALALDNESGQQQETQAFASLQEFEDATGLSAFALDTSIYHCEAVDAFTIDGETQLNVVYSCEYGGVYTTQIWNMSAELSALTNDMYKQYTTSLGRTIYYGVDKLDGSICGLTVMEDSVLFVFASKTVPIEMVLMELDF